MLGFVTFATHKRIVAEKDAEIAGLMKRLEGFAFWMKKETEENDRLRSRLAPFIKIRARDGRGRFIKDIVS